MKKVLLLVLFSVCFVNVVFAYDTNPPWQVQTYERYGMSITPAAIESVFMVPMRDSVLLRTKVFLPDTVPEEGVPTMLTRTPYKFTEGDLSAFCSLYTNQARFFANNGYAYVLQDCRGRFESEGTFGPYGCEFNDGYDATEWIAEQWWSNGEVGTIGGSYDGFTALATAVNNPYVKVVIADDAARDIRYVFRDGAVGLGLIGWLYLLDHGGWPPDSLQVVLTNALNVAGLDEFLLGYTHPFWQGFVETENPVHTYWDDISIESKYHQICAPVLSVHYTGASNLDDAIKLWRGFQATGCLESREDYRLIITPEDHCFHSANLAHLTTFVNQFMMDYIDKFLGGEAIDLSEVKNIQYRASDDAPGVYSSCDEWPPVDGYEMVFYLHNTSGSVEGGTLNDLLPGVESPDELFIDPAVMLPSLDYPTAVYTSDPLGDSLYLAGAPVVDLYASATTPGADFAALLVEYNEEIPGLYSAVGSGIFRGRYYAGYDDPTPLLPDELVNIKINFFPTAYRIREGSQLILFLSGGFPGFAENPLTGEPLAGQTEWLTSTHKIYHDLDHPSNLIIPLIPYDTRVAEYKSLKPEKVSMRVYPNPFNSSIIIAIGGSLEVTPLRLEICDVNGRIVHKWEGENNYSRLTRSQVPEYPVYTWFPEEDLNSGVYLIRVLLGANSYVNKVVYLK